MTCLHGLSFRFLFVLAFLGFLAAAYISYERYKVESNDQTVEMVYDYGKLEGRAKEDLFALYRESGITSLALYDDTPSKIMDRGDAMIYRGADMAAFSGDSSRIFHNRIYIQPSRRANGWEFFCDLERSLRLRLGENRVHRITMDDGIQTLEIQADWMKFLEMPVGILPARVREAAKSGFYLVLRPLNVSHPDKEDVEEFLRAVDASDRVSAVLFVGKEAFGYKEQLNEFQQAMAARHIPIVLIEAQSQLGFENQAGALDMVRNSNFNTVRLYAMSQNELVQLTPEEASARFYISDIERNIRMNLFPSYKFSMDGKSLDETNAEYISMVKSRLEAHGFQTGKASQMIPYFPNPLLRAAAMTGALSICVMAILCLLPCLSRFTWPIWGTGFLLTQGLYWGLPQSLLPLQMLALGTEIATPVVIVSFFLQYCLKKKGEAETKKSGLALFGEGAVVLWCCGLLSLCGGAFVSAILGDIRFFLEIAIFRGVKLTFVMPIILITLVYIQHFPFFGKVVASDRDFVDFVKNFCKVPIKLGLLAGLGFLAFAGFMFVGRSGNNMAPVPGFEIALRRFLEDHMYARPREKEFLFGHPAVFLSLAALYERWPQVLHYLLIIAVTIGQGSMVETFAHMRSPFILSFIRGLDGLAAGTAAGVFAVVGVVILLRITKFFGERYGKL